MKLSILRFLAIISPTSSTQLNPFNDDLPIDDLINVAVDGSSTTKWPSRDDRVIPAVEDALEKFRYSESPDVELRCKEFQSMILGPEPGTPITTLHLLKELFPFDGACEDIHVDLQLSFLDDFVSSSLASGARPYLPPSHRTCSTTLITEQSAIPDVSISSTNPPFSGLKFTPYAAPQKPPPNALLQMSRTADTPPTPTSSTIQQTSSPVPINLPSEPTDNSGSVFKVSGPRKWGPQGYQGKLSKLPSQSTTPPSMLKPATSINPSLNQMIPSSLSDPKPLTERELTAKALFSGLIPSSDIDSSRQNGIILDSDLESGSILTSHLRQNHLLQENRRSLTTTSSSLKGTGDGGGLKPSNNRQLLPHDLLDLGQPTSAVNGQSDHKDMGHNLFVDDNVSQASVNYNSNDLILYPDSPMLQSTSILSEPRHLDLMSSLNDVQLVGEAIPDSDSSPSSFSSRFRPFPTTTFEVGNLWGTLPIEKRAIFTLHPKYNSISVLFQKFRELLNIAIVELIGVEGIGATQLIDKQNTPIFIHAKAGIQRVYVILRGSDEIVLQEIFTILETSLQESL